MQVKVLKRQSNTIVALFVVCSEKVFHVPKFCIDCALVTQLHLEDCILERRERCVYTRRKVCTRVIHREQINLATQTHQSNQ